MKSKIQNPQVAILKAALEEFSIHGYEKASTNCIAKSAGISKGTIFNYFKSKENLFKAVMKYSLQQFQKELSFFTINSTDPFVIIKNSIFFIYGFYLDHSQVYTIYLKSVYDTKIPNRSELLKVVKFFTSAVTYKIINVLKKQQFITSEYSKKALLFLINSVIWVIINSHFLEGKSVMDNGQLLNELVRLIVNSIKKEACS